jgi:hypothetical protein
LKTDELLEKLATNLVPISKVHSLKRTWAIVFLSSLAAVSFFLVIHPLRSQLGLALHEGPLLLEVVLLVLCASFISALAVSLGFPGHSYQKPLFALSGVSLTVLLGYLIFANFSEGSLPSLEPERNCSEIVVTLSLVPSALSFILVRRLFSTKPRVSAWSIGLFSVLLSAAALGFVCPNDHRLHLLVWHLGLPALAFFLVLPLFGNRILRW